MPDLSESDEGEINRSAGAARAGDSEAFDRLVHQLTPRILGLLRHRGASWEIAEELAQETWLRVVQHLSKYDPERSFLNWVFAIATYRWMDWLKTRERKPMAAILPTDVIHFVDGDCAIEDRIERLSHCLKRLSNEERIILRLRWWEGFTLERIASTLGVDYGAVKGKHFRAVLRLRRCMGMGES